MSERWLEDDPSKPKSTERAELPQTLRVSVRIIEAFAGSVTTSL